MCVLFCIGYNKVFLSVVEDASAFRRAFVIFARKNVYFFGYECVVFKYGWIVIFYVNDDVVV